MYKAFNPNDKGAQTIYLSGKSIKGAWVYGDLLRIPYSGRGDYVYYIVEEMDWRDTIYDIHRYACDVIPETVGEAVPGLKDSQGNQIYNHDIVECRVIRCGGTWNNWCRSVNKNHGKCRMLPMEVYDNEEPYGTCIFGYSFRPTEAAQLLIKEYEKPVGSEKTKQQINWYNIKREDLIRVIGTIFDKENNK